MHRFRYRYRVTETQTIELSAAFNPLFGKNMKLLRVILCAIALLTGTTFAHARSSGDTHQSSSISIDSKEGDGPERVTRRQLPVSGKLYLLSTNRWSEMMLKDDAVYLQITDYGMKQVGEPKDDRVNGDSFLGNVLNAMALSGVKQLLNHSLALSLVDMRSALVRDGEVVLVTCQGKEVFNKVKINDRIQKYSQDKAEDFVKSINRLREKMPTCRT